ncbi:MAG: YlaI family protein [Bacillaceae bacterium]|nr:YlaI family protein [Bacillaceae bacterium]
MRVKCVLCDKVESIDSYSLTAKQLRKRRILTYMCDECNERIKRRTVERKKTGNFRLFREKKKHKHL